MADHSGPSAELAAAVCVELIDAGVRIMSTVPQGGVAMQPTASRQPIFILACCVVSICASTQVFKAVLPLWILERTHDASYMAAVRFVEYVPLFLMFWLFGWLIDSLRSRTLLLGIGVVACLSSWTIFRHDDMPPPASLLLV
ncbi:hypothetical protein LJR296_007256 [Cupriavidus necator]|uniref:hypothetical protein n=1 Tax=Cupriavidus necator TaxID=106590 RepID=UPI003ECD0EB7